MNVVESGCQPQIEEAVDERDQTFAVYRRRSSGSESASGWLCLAALPEWLCTARLWTALCDTQPSLRELWGRDAG